jgi:hypothetical protein
MAGLLDAANRVLNYHVQGYKPMNTQMGLLSAALPSPYGDVVGAVADAAGYAADPSSLTPMRGLLSLAALAPGIPASTDYRLMHKAMDESGGAARLHDLVPSFGEDVYGPNAQRYFGGGDAFDRAEKQILSLMKKLRGKPDEMVTIYRGVPKDVAAINEGDWVTLLPEVAAEYGPKVISQKVPASHVTSWADSLLEFGYHPPKVSK